jgi:hypothetical protein
MVCWLYSTGVNTELEREREADLELLRNKRLRKVQGY